MKVPVRVFWRVTGFFVGVVVILAGTPSVSFAHPLSISSKITVSGVVPPRVFLIVNKSGDIQKIFSNSDQDAEPMALLGSLDGGAAELTGSTLAQYQELKPNLSFKYGYIYQKPLPKTAKAHAAPLKRSVLANVELAAAKLL